MAPKPQSPTGKICASSRIERRTHFCTVMIVLGRVKGDISSPPTFLVFTRNMKVGNIWHSPSLDILISIDLVWVDRMLSSLYAEISSLPPKIPSPPLSNGPPSGLDHHCQPLMMCGCLCCLIGTLLPSLQHSSTIEVPRGATEF